MVTYECTRCHKMTIDIYCEEIPHNSLCPRCHPKQFPEHYVILQANGQWASRRTVVSSCPPCSRYEESTWRGYRTQAQSLILQGKRLNKQAAQAAKKARSVDSSRKSGADVPPNFQQVGSS